MVSSTSSSSIDAPLRILWIDFLIFQIPEVLLDLYLGDLDRLPLRRRTKGARQTAFTGKVCSWYRRSTEGASHTPRPGGKGFVQ